MPAQLSYPGVYIEELSSGVHTITGVATSITLFIGWAPQGPTDKALRILSFADYERFYGPIHPHSYLGYTVRQFFDNGGSDAYVLRLVQDGGENGKCSCGGIDFLANSIGEWSSSYGVGVQKNSGNDKFTVSVVKFGKNDQGQPATSEEDQKKFPPIVLEVFRNLSTLKDDERYFKEIIEDESRGSIYIKANHSDGASTDLPKPFSGGTETPMALIDDISTDTWIDPLKKAIEEDGVLDRIDLFNLLCVPGLTNVTALGLLTSFCSRRRAMLIADCSKDASIQNLQSGAGIDGIRKNGAFYFPWLRAPDELAKGAITDFPPCGFMAGLYARTDTARGVWKAPAGTEASVVGVVGPQTRMTDKENGTVNVKAVNCIRTFPVYGTISWGARTLDGDDEATSEWKYIPVRRTALYIEESLFRGTKWVVFEPNDEPLWAQIRLNVGAFMHGLFRLGAFQGSTPKDAYFVKCDKENNPQDQIDKGIVHIKVGFAPLKPAEFVVIQIQQIAGQIEV